VSRALVVISGLGSSGIAVPNEALVGHAERLLAGPVGLDALALGFAESSASSVEVLVEGESFYPPMVADVESASSSVHINQFGFRPGIVGDVFADALIRKAEEGVPVRLIVDRQGSDPELAGSEVRGIAVHTGARVGANAGPGEVLASSTVKDLVAGSGLEFEYRSSHELKGVPGEWRLYAVSSL
jgi:hypothetical protein